MYIYNEKVYEINEIIYLIDGTNAIMLELSA